MVDSEFDSECAVKFDSTVDSTATPEFDSESPQHVLVLADRILATTAHSGTTARFIHLVRRHIERLINIEDDFKSIVHRECAPDEVHCSCVPHLRRAYYELSERVVQSLAPLLGFPHAPDENGNEDTNAPYVVDPFVAEDIVELTVTRLRELVEQAQLLEPNSVDSTTLGCISYALESSHQRLQPLWFDEIPTEEGDYWFYGRSEYERNSSYVDSTPVRTRLVKFRLGGREPHIHLYATMEGSFAYPRDEKFIGKWSKVAIPTPV